MFVEELRSKIEVRQLFDGTTQEPAFSLDGYVTKQKHKNK